MPTANAEACEGREVEVVQSPEPEEIDRRLSSLSEAFGAMLLAVTALGFLIALALA